MLIINKGLHQETFQIGSARIIEPKAEHDHLTGLYNRIDFNRAVHSIEADPACFPLGIILADIDGMKKFNDTLGTEAGDRFLIKTASLIKTAVGGERFVARIGEDEFAALFLRANRLTVESALKRIKGAVIGYNQYRRGVLPLSLSAGYSLCNNGCNNELDKAIKQAEDHMNREKLQHRQSQRNSVIQTLLAALKARDFTTEDHSNRLGENIERFAQSIDLPTSTISELLLLGQFHDIGKLGIKDNILFKPGPLDPDEMEDMRRHCEIGCQIAMSSVELRPIADWILKHHEWWNGKGYPLGLKEEEIPLECRILTIVDSYDAMTHNRPYRKAMGDPAAQHELKKYSGIQFDPELVDKYLLFINE